MKSPLSPLSPRSEFSEHWPEISALLDEALDLPERERAAWLEGLAGAQSTHRETLRVLLGYRSGVETDDFLNTLTMPDSGPSSKPVDVPPSGPAAGDSVGAYRLIEQIGEGGMGTVWLAEREDKLMNRRVALKLPRIAWGETFAERLAREREILATLEHEHIARLYDAGVDAHGRPFLAMEHVAGEALDVYLDNHSLSIRERIALLLQVMSAVSHAHAHLVVHRDLKPSNILVTPEGQVKLLDFGVAKLLEGDATQRTALTELTGRAMTPDYASPEQIRGEPLGTSSDVYGLAVVAYEVLSGARPYRLKRGSAAEMEEAIANAEPRLASDAATTPAARKALRGDLDAILNRGLKKSAADRYPSVESFAQDLQLHLRGEPVLARPDSAHYRLAKFVRRHAAAVAMTSALTLAIVIGAGLSLWQARVARQQERAAIAETEGAAAVRELYVETTMRLSVMATDDPEALKRPHAVTLALRRQLDEMAPRLVNRPRERDAQLYAVTLQLGYTEEFEAAVEVGMQYLQSVKSHDTAPWQVIDAYSLLGTDLFRLHRYEECEAMRRAGFAWAADAHDTVTELYRQKIASGLGSVLRVLGKREEAASVFEQAERIMAVSFPNEPFRFENLKQFAQFWLGFDEARALQYAKLTHDGVLQLPESNENEKAAAERIWGYALEFNGRAAEAEAAARASLVGYAPIYGLNNRNTVRAVAAVADSMSRAGDYARSEAFIADERRSIGAAPGGLSPSTSRMLREQQLENAWLAGDASAAVSLLANDPASLLTPSAMGDNDLGTFWPLLAMDLAGHPQQALEALSAYRATISPPDRATLTWVRTLQTQALLELSAGESAAALKTAQGLLALLESSRATSGRLYRMTAELAALAAARLGDKVEAARSFELSESGPTAQAFASAVEHAESDLRRAEVFTAIGRNADAASATQAALKELGTTQHPDSPRLAMARRFVEN